MRSAPQQRAGSVLVCLTGEELGKRHVLQSVILFFKLIQLKHIPGDWGWGLGAAKCGILARRATAPNARNPAASSLRGPHGQWFAPSPTSGGLSVRTGRMRRRCESIVLVEFANDLAQDHHVVADSIL